MEGPLLLPTFYWQVSDPNVPMSEASAADRTRRQRPEAHHQEGRL